MRFTKMQALGNDYLYVYAQAPENAGELARRLSDRHFGAGADGLIFIAPARTADFRMRVFNADGSEAQMCGNGIRCVGKYVYDKGYTDKSSLTIETAAGLRRLELRIADGRVRSVTVDMGKAAVRPDLLLDVEGEAIVCTPVSVGNPHAVVFARDVESVPLARLGPRIERHARFPEGTNVEFIEALAGDRIRMRVWERGSGVTLACGTGACAAAAAAVRKGYCPAGAPITVLLDGGELTVAVAPDGGVAMTGPAAFVYEGETCL